MITFSSLIASAGGGGYPSLGDVIETAATTLAGGQTLLPLDGSTYANSAYPALAALLTTDPYNNWAEMATPTVDIGSVSVSGSNMVANAIGYPALYSNDGGDTWLSASGGTTLTGVLTYKTACSGNNMVALGLNTAPPYMNWSRDAGATWSTRTLGTSGNWRDVALDGNNGLFCGYDTVEYNKVKYTTDGFDTWSDSTLAGGFADEIYQCALKGSKAIIVCEQTSNGAYYSTDGGVNFTKSTTPSLAAVNPSAASINSSGKAVFTNTNGQICLSTDGGANFTLLAVGPSDNTVKGVHVWENGEIWMTGAQVIYKTSDDFVTYTTESIGSDMTNISTFYDLKIDESAGTAVIGGVSGAARALANPTTFTLPNRAGSGNIRDRIVAED